MFSNKLKLLEYGTSRSLGAVEAKEIPPASLTLAEGKLTPSFSENTPVKTNSQSRANRVGCHQKT